MNNDRLTIRKLNLLIWILSVAAAFCVMAIIHAVTCLPRLPDTRIYPDLDTELTDGWYLISGGQKSYVSEFPVKLEDSQGLGVSFYNDLPYIGDDCALMFMSKYHHIQVYVDDGLIYDSGVENKPLFGHMTGNYRCVIPLDSEYAGKTLEIHLISPYGNRIYFDSVHLGRSDQYIIGMLLNNAGVIICVLFMLIFSVFLLAVYAWQYFSKLTYNYGFLLYLSIFIMLSSVWILTDTDLLQLVYGNSVAICLLSFYSFMVLPVPLLSFLTMICDYGGKAVRAAQILMLINVFVQTFFYVAGIADFPQMLLFTHSLIIISVVIAINALIHEVITKSFFYAAGMLTAISVISVFSVAALAMFYIEPLKDNSRLFRYGLIAFILVLSYLSIKKMMEFIEDHANAEIYKNLAYMDVMTKTKNRISFDSYMEHMRETGITKDITFVMFDLNNLKFTNDNWGHRAGDCIISGAAECIRKAFGSLGELYRIGGDEFVLVTECRENELMSNVDELNEAIAEFNQRSSYMLSIAVGIADSSRLEGIIDADALLKEADMSMYADKAVNKFARRSGFRGN